MKTYLTSIILNSIEQQVYTRIPNIVGASWREEVLPLTAAAGLEVEEADQAAAAVPPAHVGEAVTVSGLGVTLVRRPGGPSRAAAASYTTHSVSGETGGGHGAMLMFTQLH